MMSKPTVSQSIGLKLSLRIAQRAPTATEIAGEYQTYYIGDIPSFSHIENQLLAPSAI